MAKLENLALLVQSLSKAEKKAVRMYAGLYEGDKFYMKLFDILDKGDIEGSIKEKFIKVSKGASFEMACKHLFKVVTRVLVMNEIETGPENTLLLMYLESKILFSKQLQFETFKHIHRALKLAVEHQLVPQQIMFLRLELEYLKRIEFVGYTEAEILALHDKVARLQKEQQQVMNHTELYNMLQYRFIHKGAAKTPEHESQLQDLVMSEMQLYNSPRYNSFQASKIHLLFQSTYFSLTGDIKSALRTFYELDKLFIENTLLWQDSPITYIEHLNGILENLKKLDQFTEMDYFIDRLKQLQNLSQQDTLLVSLLIFEYQTWRFLKEKKVDKALEFQKEVTPVLLSKRTLLPPTLKARACIYMAMIFFAQRDFKSASKQLNSILNEVKVYKNLPVYRAVRLMSVVMHFEQYKFDYLDYEIKAFQTQISKREQIYEVEKTIFGFIKKYMNTLSKSRYRALIQEAKEKLIALKADKYEMQLLADFDFIAWLEEKKV